MMNTGEIHGPIKEIPTMLRFFLLSTLNTKPSSSNFQSHEDFSQRHIFPSAIVWVLLILNGGCVRVAWLRALRAKSCSESQSCRERQ